MNIPELQCEKYCHFRQHYVKMGYRYSKAFCGHCVHPRLKHRRPWQKVCDHYSEKAAD